MLTPACPMSSKPAVHPVRVALLSACVALFAASASARQTGTQQAAPEHHPAHSHERHRHHRPPHDHAVHHALHPAHPAAPPVVPVPAPVPPPVAPPPPAVPANRGTNTNLPLPRFASLRADEVNMRSGPGTRYPILWLYKRRELPVEIMREFDVWRLVEDADGVRGWVHQATLVGNRTFVVTATGGTDRGPGTVMRDDPQEDGGVVAILRPGVIGRLRACPTGSAWCRVSVHNYSGWLQRSDLFGLLPNETITPP